MYLPDTVRVRWQTIAGNEREYEEFVKSVEDSALTLDAVDIHEAVRKLVENAAKDAGLQLSEKQVFSLCDAYFEEEEYKLLCTQLDTCLLSFAEGDYVMVEDIVNTIDALERSADKIPDSLLPHLENMKNTISTAPENLGEIFSEVEIEIHRHPELAMACEGTERDGFPPKEKKDVGEIPVETLLNECASKLGQILAKRKNHRDEKIEV